MTNDNEWVAFRRFFYNRWVIRINILIIINIIFESKTSDTPFSLSLVVNPLLFLPPNAAAVVVINVLLLRWIQRKAPTKSCCLHNLHISWQQMEISLTHEIERSPFK